MKKIVVGIYPGRSGSKSLVYFLNMQPDVQAHWESTEFRAIPALNDTERRLDWLQKQPMRVVCDIDYRWLWHLDHILDISDAVVIYLYRKPEEIAKSFVSYLRPYAQKSGWKNYPYQGYQGTEEEIVRSASQYHEEVRQIMKERKGRIIQLDVEDINNMARMNRVLDHLGVSKEGRKEKRFHIRKLMAENYAERGDYEEWNTKRLLAYRSG